ncbi:MAG: DUF4062 domain-containing protein [Verrucomicrobia bacterium]|nr:DUF4062 domain-containing protein [Verrucomicrobiota bacterium]
MATSSKIRVMISSRCNDRFPHGIATSPTLTDLRTELRNEIEAVEIFGSKPFEVWINEIAPPKGGTWDSWDVCIEAVKDCDVLLVLSNGNAGWAKNKGDIGICHAELMTGLSQAPGKVSFLSLGNIPADKTDQGVRNQRFQEYVAQQSLFRGGEVKTVAQLKTRVNEALHEALVTLVQRGVREASKGRFYSGQALDWTRMDFAGRQSEMIRVLREAVLQRSNALEDAGNLFVTLNGGEVLIATHAIPAALSVGAAKELVGQPFLKDHGFDKVLTGKRTGPVHLIACHKAATESQATRLLGFPDATFVSAPFGVYVADNLHKVQLAYISNCRDEANTRHGVQRFFEWLEQTGEDVQLAKRAASRAKIVKAIAKEI